MENNPELKYPILLNKELQIENILSPLTSHKIDSIEKIIGVPLPNSYKYFLKSCGGFSAKGGVVQLGRQHPFIHEFESYEELTDEQKNVVKQKGGQWPPPSNGMICFGEFFLEADGDQVLFDTKEGLIDGEYPVYYYYSHESYPPKVRKIANSFNDWIAKLPDYLDNDEE
jgi:hypothetical protein